MDTRWLGRYFIQLDVPICKEPKWYNIFLDFMTLGKYKDDIYIWFFMYVNCNKNFDLIVMCFHVHDLPLLVLSVTLVSSGSSLEDKCLGSSLFGFTVLVEDLVV